MWEHILGHWVYCCDVASVDHPVSVRVPVRCCRENRAGGVVLASCVEGEVLVLDCWCWCWTAGAGGRSVGLVCRRGGAGAGAGAGPGAGGPGTEHFDPEEQGQESRRKMGTKGGRRVVGADAGAFEKGEVQYYSALLEGCRGINQQCNHLGEQTHAATWSGFLDNSSRGAPDARASHDEDLSRNEAG